MTDQKKEKKPHSLQDALRDALKRLPHDQQQRVRKVLHEKGVLKDVKGE
jgi:hypothetical protein